MASSSAVRAAGSTAGSSQEAAAEEEAASSFVPLRRWTTVDADVGVDVEEMEETAATTFAWSSADQLPTSAASASSPSDARTSATFVADEAMEDTGVEAMSSNRRRGVKEAGKRKADEPRMLRFVGNMLILTCTHVLHNK